MDGHELLNDYAWPLGDAPVLRNKMLENLQVSPATRSQSLKVRLSLRSGFPRIQARAKEGALRATRPASGRPRLTATSTPERSAQERPG